MNDKGFLMSELEDCSACNGRKVSRLGGIEKKCIDCDGIGYVKKKETKIITPEIHDKAITAAFNSIDVNKISDGAIEKLAKTIDKEISKSITKPRAKKAKR